MFLGFRKSLGPALGALVFTTVSLGPPTGPGPIDTIAERLAKLDRFENKEDAAGLDRFRPDGRNWYDYDILSAAVVAEGSLLPAVTNPETAVTLLAPNDRAFQLLAYDLTGKWLYSEPDVLAAIVAAVESGDVNLTNVLTYHVIPGKVERADVPFNTAVGTLNSETITFRPLFFGFLVEIEDSVDAFRNPFLLRTDLDAGESVVHGISRVLIPGNVGD